MADASNTSGAAEKGAAEEPEPEPGEPPSITATATAAAASATYDPREYQPAHPDDRGGGVGKKATKGKSKAKAKAKDGKGEGEGEGKEKDEGGGIDDSHRCGNCDAPDAKSKCKGCGVEYYCNRECQKVRVQVVS